MRAVKAKSTEEALFNGRHLKMLAKKIQERGGGIEKAYVMCFPLGSLALDGCADIYSGLGDSRSQAVFQQGVVSVAGNLEDNNTQDAETLQKPNWPQRQAG